MYVFQFSLVLCTWFSLALWAYLSLLILSLCQVGVMSAKSWCRHKNFFHSFPPEKHKFEQLSAHKAPSWEPRIPGEGRKYRFTLPTSLFSKAWEAQWSDILFMGEGKWSEHLTSPWTPETACPSTRPILSAWGGSLKALMNQRPQHILTCKLLQSQTVSTAPGSQQVPMNPGPDSIGHLPAPVAPGSSHNLKRLPWHQAPRGSKNPCSQYIPVSASSWSPQQFLWIRLPSTPTSQGSWAGPTPGQLQWIQTFNLPKHQANLQGQSLEAGSYRPRLQPCLSARSAPAHSTWPLRSQGTKPTPAAPGSRLSLAPRWPHD